MDDSRRLRVKTWLTQFFFSFFLITAIGASIIYLRNQPSELDGQTIDISDASSLLRLGALKPGKAYFFDLLVRNSSENKLTVFEIRTSCGCTSPETRLPLELPSKGKIHTSIRVNTLDDFGDIRRTLRFILDDSRIVKLSLDETSSSSLSDHDSLASHTLFLNYTVTN